MIAAQIAKRVFMIAMCPIRERDGQNECRARWRALAILRESDASAMRLQHGAHDGEIHACAAAVAPRREETVEDLLAIGARSA
nr:hypothetical protein [Methylosinus sp. PW1]